jgi:acyl-CoA reductase-like NAD-dependent aldehyde dehydrogenase
MRSAGPELKRIVLELGEHIYITYVHLGRSIMRSAGPELKRIVLELGGKDPMVVFGDADLDAAAEQAVEFALFNCGQVSIPLVPGN